MSPETASRLAEDLIGLLKLMHAVRQQAPRLHPGVDAAAYPLLFTLRTGPMRLSALAEQVHSDVSTVSRQVSALVTAGLVERLPDPDDRRAQLLRLPGEAERLLDEVRERRAEWFRAVLAGWSEPEAQQAVQALTRLRESIVASRTDSGTGPVGGSRPAVGGSG